jgi:cardiolipin synthase (CMP-forming)
MIACGCCFIPMRKAWETHRPAFRVRANPISNRIMMSLPNILTLSRIVTVPVLVALLWYPGWELGWLLGFALYCLMGITDYFDGYLARAQGAVSRLGIFLDPIADKIMIAAVILMLVGTRHDAASITGLHLIPALVILIREIAVSGLREFLAGLQVSVPVSQLAKWKTAFQMVALGALILAGGLPDQAWIKIVGVYTLWIAAALTLITGWDYLRVGLKHMD